MMVAKRAEGIKQEILCAYAEYVRKNEENPSPKRKDIWFFPGTYTGELSFDELMNILLSECVKAAGEGKTAMRFDLNYEESVLENNDPQQLGNDDICVSYFLPHEYGKTPIKWNSRNTPHLAAEIATTMFRQYDLSVSFPFTGTSAAYEIELLTKREESSVRKMLHVEGGYRAFSEGVPLHDIIV